MNHITNYFPLFKPLTHSTIWYFYDDINKLYEDENFNNDFNKVIKGTNVGLAKHMAYAWTDEWLDLVEKAKYVLNNQYTDLKEVVEEGLTETLKYWLKLIVEIFKIILSNPYIIASLIILSIYFLKK